MLTPAPARSRKEERALEAGVLQTFMAMWQDDPKGFMLLVAGLQARPTWGSITVIFQKGEISQVDKKEISKP